MLTCLFRQLLSLMRKRYQTGKTSSLKAKIKAMEAELDVTSIMLAREQAKYEVREKNISAGLGICSFAARSLFRSSAVCSFALDTFNVGKLKTGLKHLFYTFWLCFYKKRAKRAIHSCHSLQKIKKSHSLFKNSEREICSFWQKTNDSQEKPKSEFPTLHLW